MKEEDKSKDVKKTTLLSLFINVLLSTIKWTAGILGNSYALIADALESTIDIVSSFIVLFGLHYSNKPADENHPYGHGRIEPIITFSIVLLMLVSATLIVYESFKNIFTPHLLPKSWTLYVLAVIIIWKETAYRVVLRKSKQLKSTTLKAEAWHHRSDAYTSIAAFIGISLALILGKGFEYMDDIAALIAGFFIAFNAFKIFRPAWGEIMDENTYEEFIQTIRSEAKNFPEISDIEKCHVRKLGVKLFVDMHMEVDGKMTVRKGHEIAHEFKDYLLIQHPEIGDVLIHLEPKYER